MKTTKIFDEYFQEAFVSFFPFFFTKVLLGSAAIQKKRKKTNLSSSSKDT
jgi:hypothetical protein